jgi:hypothetical protein
MQVKDTKEKRSSHKHNNTHPRFCLRVAAPRRAGVSPPWSSHPPPREALSPRRGRGAARQSSRAWWRRPSSSMMVCFEAKEPARIDRLPGGVAVAAMGAWMAAVVCKAVDANRPDLGPDGFHRVADGMISSHSDVVSCSWASPFKNTVQRCWGLWP